MQSNYASIRAANVRRYGTEIGRIGPMLMSERYDDRTHFIFELLQNAENALARRDGWSGPRAVTFELSSTALRISHFGTPFTEDDVRGICGIDETTRDRDLTSIGRFGIGFKSVYAYTDSPEIHSGEEHFGIDSYVWPRAIPTKDAKPRETVFILPLRPKDASAREEITEGLRRLGPQVLLFLREIEEISWAVEGGSSGLYLRCKAELLADNARKVVIIGEEHGAAEVTEETWLVFSRAVRTENDLKAGYVEVAFTLGDGDDSDSVSVRPLDDSALVVFFPTIVPTNVRFLVQGPYHTTPSRDNVPWKDLWNQHLVRETATLLVEALHVLRKLGLLDATALCSLPLDRAKFGAGSRFAPLFEAVRVALSSQPLLPRFRGGHVPASAARLARTQELRELLSPAQLAALFQVDQELAWLSGDITQDRTLELWRYLRWELGIAVVTPETILSRLTRPFLEAQSDEWIVRLYEFLHGQPALLRYRRLDDVPLIRLEDGSHVTPRKGGKPQAFLPGPISTDFSTVSRAVYVTDGARALLTDLGLTEPDPVDDVVRNVLPKYVAIKGVVSVADADYEGDIQRILQAFATDSKAQREKLRTALRNSTFVQSVDAGDGSKWFSRPIQVYLASQSLKVLFEGVPDVFFVDDSYPCLLGEDVCELLQACGAAPCLQPISVKHQFTWDERWEMRRKGGCKDCTDEGPIEDFTLRGLEGLLNTLPSLDAALAKTKGGLLWEALCDLEAHRGTHAFYGVYHWFYYRQRSYEFDAAFVRQLNETAWVPDRSGTLQPPGFVVFNETGWKPSPFLLSKIPFRASSIEALAREAGIEPGVLDLLKKFGITSEAELKDRLGITDNAPQPEPKPDDADLTPAEALRKLHIPSPTPPVGSDEIGSKPGSPDDGGSGAGSRRGTASGGRGRQGTAPLGGRGRGRGSAGDTAPLFISYLGVHAQEDEPDPDGLDQRERMALEEQAINLIVKHEPQLLRMPVNNPGFDLVENDSDDQPVRWVEVKAMTGILKSRPVGLSRTQFETAQEHGDRYWLYVVERAGSPEGARIVRIQDPVGKARTFTFDHGWLSVAEVSDPTELDRLGEEL